MTPLNLVRDYADAAPLARWLGFSAEMAGGDIVYHLGFGEHHIGNKMIRAIHGGVIASFLEFSAQAALYARLNGERSLSTVNIDIDYISSARSQDLAARVRFTRVGRRIAFAEATGWQTDETVPIATARFRFQIC